MRHRFAGLALGLGFLLAASAPAMASPALGVWLTDEGKAKVRISKCGSGLCSNIIWLRRSKDENGKPLRDSYNPNPKLKRRRIIGLRIMTGLRKSGTNQWSGHIYNPEDGKTYQAHLTLVKPNLIILKGCTLWGWPCGRKQWVRTKDPRPKPKPKPQVVAAKARKPAARKPARPAATPAPSRSQVRSDRAKPQRHVAARAAAAPKTGPRRQPKPMTLAGTAGSGEGYLVQVAARKSQNGAREAFARLREQFPQILGSYQPVIQRADLGAKGVWFRLRVGPISERTAAADLCQRLRTAGGPACFVRRQ